MWKQRSKKKYCKTSGISNYNSRRMIFFQKPKDKCLWKRPISMIRKSQIFKWMRMWMWRKARKYRRAASKSAKKSLRAMSVGERNSGDRILRYSWAITVTSPHPWLKRTRVKKMISMAPKIKGLMVRNSQITSSYPKLLITLTLRMWARWMSLTAQMIKKKPKFIIKSIVISSIWSNKVLWIRWPVILISWIKT